MARIGAFLVYQPTFSFDTQGIISAIFSGRSQAMGVFGFIPELFELILFAVDYLVEIIFIRFIIPKKVETDPSEEIKFRFRA